MEKNNKLVIIPKIEKYIEYMLTITLKLPRTGNLVCISKTAKNVENNCII